MNGTTTTESMELLEENHLNSTSAKMTLYPDPIKLKKYPILSQILTPFCPKIKGSIHSIMLEEDDLTLFDYFLEENQKNHYEEVKSIVNRLEIIGKETGARESFFKVAEGLPGDGVCALYDQPESKLRLYCIRYGSVAIVVGGGGPKPNSIRAWQENEKLSKEANLIIQVSKDIIERLKDGEVKWTKDGSKLLGNLTFKNNEDE